MNFQPQPIKREAIDVDNNIIAEKLLPQVFTSM